MSDDENTDTYDSETKVVLIGKSSVGKTSLVMCALSGGSTAEPQSTVGATFSTKAHTFQGKTVLVQIWDTAGHERFRSMTPLYFRGARIVLIVFALDDLSSFEDVDVWNGIVDEHVPNVAKILIGNKSDLSGRAVTEETAKQKAKEIGADYIATSAIKGPQLTELFALIASDVIENSKIADHQEIPVAIPVSQTSSGCC
jgi:small GTP-binding protein